MLLTVQGWQRYFHQKRGNKAVQQNNKIAPGELNKLTENGKDVRADAGYTTRQALQNY